MDDIINREILYGSRPPKNVCFTVVVEYNSMHPIFNGEIKMGDIVVSEPLPNFLAAMELSERSTQDMISEKFEDGVYEEVDPVESDGFHLHILDGDNDPLARVGIVMIDYREETIH